MTMMDALNQVFRQVFNDETIRIRPDMTANDIEGWDSISHVNLILAVEARFHLRFSQREILSMRNVGDLMRLIEAKAAAPR